MIMKRCYAHTQKKPATTQTLEANSVPRQQSTRWVTSGDTSSPQKKIPAGLPCSGSVLTTSELRQVRCWQEQCPGRLEREPDRCKRSCEAEKIRRRKGRKRISLPSTPGGQSPQLKGARADSPNHHFQFRNTKMSKRWTMQRKDRSPVELTRGWGGEGAGQGGIAEWALKDGEEGQRTVQTHLLLPNSSKQVKVILCTLDSKIKIITCCKSSDEQF